MVGTKIKGGEIMNAYNQGYEAYLDGLDAEHNPYPEWEEAFEEWDDGFFNAAKEEDTDREMT